jgi:drug/metabolite transporter (DMT)-like permease
MQARLLVLVLTGSLCAAGGQILFKLGATGRETLVSFVNGWIVLGLGLYAAGTVLWIYALSKAHLTVVYPFTALTFVIVYLFGSVLLGEPASAKALAGVALVLLGLFFIATA